ncbi:MAG: hypothetical protein Q8K82_09660 [Gemmatimonadaceae bacterium]|nr:hypothetical protein [Gemmatimonadaceae bacterium]
MDTITPFSVQFRNVEPVAGVAVRVIEVFEVTGDMQAPLATPV